MLELRASKMANLEIICGTYEEFLIGYRLKPSKDVSTILAVKKLILICHILIAEIQKQV